MIFPLIILDGFLWDVIEGTEKAMVSYSPCCRANSVLQGMVSMISMIDLDFRDCTIAYDLVARLALDMGGEAYTTTVLFIFGVVEPLFLG